MMPMRFRNGVIVGFAVGYYLGTKAPLERHEQIDQALTTIRRSRPYRGLHDAALDTLDEARLRVVDAIRGAAFGSREPDFGADPTEPIFTRELLDDTLELDRSADPSWN